MRPEAIRRRAEAVHKALWTHPDHDLVAWVRESILQDHAALAEEISTGTLLEDDRLGEVLSVIGADGPRVLAGVLWASGFDGPHAESLFRILVPLADPSPSSEEPKVVARDYNQQLRSLKAELRAVKKDLKRAKQEVKDTKRALRKTDRPVEDLRRQLADAQGSLAEAQEERDSLRERTGETADRLAKAERNLEKATNVNARFRRDLRQLQQELRDLGAERSELARKLARAKRELERLKFQLQSLPRGSEAAWEFLRAEETRIQEDRLIRAGGEKARADKEWTAYRKLKKAFLDAYPLHRQPRPVKIRPKARLKLAALGGSDEVGKSCYLLELGEHRILVDCGIKPGDWRDFHPDLGRLEHIDALILTHAHTDHVGWVPALVRKFGDFDIYCSEGTAALLPVMLEDCRRHYVREIAKRRERSKYSRDPEMIDEAYEDEDVYAVQNLAITCGFGEEEALPFGDASIRFVRAGHILGAASVLINDGSGRRVFFSGDFSSFEQLTVPAADWSEVLDELDILVLESTYGDGTHAPLVESRRGLLAFIRETVESRGGSVILASFALGRAQELLKLIVTAQQSGDLPASTPVHVDGMIRRINPIYSRFGAFQYAPEAFNEISGETERQEIVMSAQERPSIIVTTSGMLTGGPVVEYARSLLPHARHRIVFAGYQDEGAPSRALLDLARGGGARRVQVPDESGDLIEFEAAMPAKRVSLSSHADQPGLLEYAARLRPNHIALVHGEPKAQDELKFRLQQAHPRTIITCGPSELSVP